MMDTIKPDRFNVTVKSIYGYQYRYKTWNLVSCDTGAGGWGGVLKYKLRDVEGINQCQNMHKKLYF